MMLECGQGVVTTIVFSKNYLLLLSQMMLVLFIQHTKRILMMTIANAMTSVMITAPAVATTTSTTIPTTTIAIATITTTDMTVQMKAITRESLSSENNCYDS